MRNYSNFPAIAAAGWCQYQVTIPQAYITGLTPAQQSKQYLVFEFHNRHTVATGGNIYIDDISINTYPKAQTIVNTFMNFCAFGCIAIK